MSKINFKLQMPDLEFNCTFSKPQNQLISAQIVDFKELNS
jgi:hypothetical protein